MPEANCVDRVYPVTGGLQLITIGDQLRYNFIPDPALAGTYHLNKVMNGLGFTWTVSYDQYNRVVRVVNDFNRSINISYSSGMIASVWTNDGTSIYYHYSNFNGTAPQVLTSVAYPDSTAAAYAYTFATTITTGRAVLATADDPMVGGDASHMQYAYSYSATLPNGFVKQETNLQNGQAVVGIPQGGGNTPQIVEGDGTIIRKVFANDQLTKSVDGNGVETDYTYQNAGLGFIKSVTDAAGYVSNYTTNGKGQVLTLSHPAMGITAASTETSVYDSGSNFLVSHTDRKGITTVTTRNTTNSAIPLNVITQIGYNPQGSGPVYDWYETWTYNALGQPLTHRRRNGGVEHMAYFTSTTSNGFVGDLATATDAMSNVTSFTYFANGLVSSVKDARNNVTSYTYNWRGQLARVTNPDTTTHLFTYDAYGNRTSETDEMNKITYFTYTGYNKLWTIKDPNQKVTSFLYARDGSSIGTTEFYGTLFRTTLPSGKMAETTYNKSRWKVSSTIGAGSSEAATTLYDYNTPASVGDITKVTSPLANHLYAIYDQQHRNVQAYDDYSDRSEKVYDLNGNVTVTQQDVIGGQSNPAQNMTYDAENRLITLSDSLNETSHTTYNADGTVNTFKDPKGNQYSYAYDLDGRKTAMTYPDTTSEHFTYDAAGNLNSYTNRNGQVETLVYNNRNRVTQTSWSGTTAPTVTNTYDNDGRLLTASSSISTLTYTYDAAGHVMSESQAIVGAPGGARTISYTYDDDGNRKTMTLPSGMVTTYAYNNRSFLATITVNSGSPMATYTYDADGRLATKALENGTTASYTFDRANRLTAIANSGITGSSPLNLAYGYDFMNRRTYEQRDSALGDVYGYDATSQVTGVSYDAATPNTTPANPTRSVAYSYDANGNRINLTDNGLATSYLTNNLNEYTTVGGSGLSYNLNGDLLQSSTQTFSYDAQNRLLTATGYMTTAQMSYDAANRCVVRTINGATRYLYYDGWNLIEERDTSGNVIADYVHGAGTDEMIAKISTSGTVYYHQNALGSTVGLTNISGALVERYKYDAFGRPTVYDGTGNILSGTANGNRFLFTGREWLQEVSLYDYRNRIYSADLGRFVQTDPVTFAAGDWNLYRFVGNRSLDFADPMGLFSLGRTASGALEMAGGVGLIFAGGALGVTGAGIFIGVGGAMTFESGFAQLLLGLSNPSVKTISQVTAMTPSNEIVAAAEAYGYFSSGNEGASTMQTLAETGSGFYSFGSASREIAEKLAKLGIKKALTSHGFRGAVIDAGDGGRSAGSGVIEIIGEEGGGESTAGQGQGEGPDGPGQTGHEPSQSDNPGVASAPDTGGTPGSSSPSENDSPSAGGDDWPDVKFGLPYGDYDPYAPAPPGFDSPVERLP